MLRDDVAILDDAPVPSARLLRWVAPLASCAIERVLSRLTIAGVEASPHFAVHNLKRLLAMSLPFRSLVRIIHRPLLIEMHIIKRSPEFRVDDKYEGFTRFVEKLKTAQFRRSLWKKYPQALVSCRQLLDQWEVYIHEILLCITNDLNQVCATFGLGCNKVVRRITIEGGDSHQGGRSTAEVLLDGTSASLFYKPREAFGEKVYEDLCTWATRNGFELTLPTAQTLTGNGHSWALKVFPKPCTTKAEVSRFYQRMGAHIAISYALATTDLHKDNVIANGEFPILIDLETIGHRLLRCPSSLGDEIHEFDVHSAASETVLGSGLLPVPDVKEENGIVSISDISGIGGVSGAAIGEGFLHVDTTEMRVGTVSANTNLAEANIPTFSGEKISPASYADDVLNGFTEMYLALLRNRPAILGKHGPLSQLDHLETRLLFASTVGYSDVLWRSYHPALLVRLELRNNYVKQLVTNLRPPKVLPRELTSSECRQLLRGDIPYFTASASDFSIKDGENGVFQKLTISTTRTRVSTQMARLSERDLKYQVTLLRTTLSATNILGRGRNNEAAHFSRSELEDLSPVKEAIKIGEYLIAACHWSRNMPAWVNFESHNANLWRPGIMGDGFYAGDVGLVPFLSVLSDRTGDSKYRELATAIVKRAMSRATSSGVLPSERGGLCGRASGIIYALSFLPETLARHDKPRTIISKLSEAISRTLTAEVSLLDVIDGIAGTVLILASALNTGDEFLEDEFRFHIEAGLKVLESTCEMSVLAPNCVEDMAASGLAVGFAHGLSGVAIAIARGRHALGQRSPVPELLFNQEDIISNDSRFRLSVDGEQSRKTELRDLDWCHGSLGMALSRACVLEFSDSKLIRKSLDTHLSVVVDVILQHAGSERNLSLCHGALGTLHSLHRIKTNSSQSHALEEAIQVLSRATQIAIVNRGLVCGTPTNVTTTDLFTGLGGIGYGLMAMNDPSIRNVLSID